MHDIYQVTLRDDLSMLNTLAKETCLLSVARGGSANNMLHSVPIMRDRRGKRETGREGLESDGIKGHEEKRPQWGEGTSFKFNFITCYAPSLSKFFFIV